MRPSLPLSLFRSLVRYPFQLFATIILSIAHLVGSVLRTETPGEYDYHRSPCLPAFPSSQLLFLRKIRLDLTGAFDRTQSGIAGGIERGGVGGEASTGALCSPRDFDVFCGVAAAAPHSISQTTARRSCHVGVLESAAEAKARRWVSQITKSAWI